MLVSLDITGENYDVINRGSHRFFHNLAMRTHWRADVHVPDILVATPPDTGGMGRILKSELQLTYGRENIPIL